MNLRYVVQVADRFGFEFGGVHAGGVAAFVQKDEAMRYAKLRREQMDSEQDQSKVRVIYNHTNKEVATLTFKRDIDAESVPIYTPSSLTITHIAGERLNVRGRIFQRCSLCGAKLCDSGDAAAAVNRDGSVPEFHTWPEGRLVQVEAGNPTRWSVLPDSDLLPKDSCIDFA